MNATGIGPHVFVVLSNPQQDNEVVIVTTFSSCRGGPREDHSCVIEPGEHSALPDRSYVYYADAKVFPEVFIQRYTQPRDPLSPALLERVLDGAYASDYLKNDHRKKLEDQGLI